MLKYILLCIVLEHYSTVISEGKFNVLFFSFDNIIDWLDINIEHAASFVRGELWNWWDYSDGVSGPASWGFYFPICDKGRFQSPINIESRHLIFDYQLTPIYINNSDHVCLHFIFLSEKNLFFF
jgi:carbonic anhydrase